MFKKQPVGRLVWAVAICVMLTGGPARGQEGTKKGGSVPIIFVPPPVENATYSVGIYDAKDGKLVRRLCEVAGQNTFKVGLNGLITSWDGKDDDGKGLPPGKYAARGYAVGPLKVEGEAILGNDWVEDDENLRMHYVGSIAFIPGDGGLAVVGFSPPHGMQVARYGGEKIELIWQSLRTIPSLQPTAFDLTMRTDGKFLKAWAFSYDSCSFRMTNGEQADWPESDVPPQKERQSSGQNGTVWKIEEGVLTQYSSQGERLRSLAPKAGEPVPVAVVASPDTDRIYLLEEMKGWQRVRGLSWVETKEQGDKSVSTWRTFFERNIRRIDPIAGIVDLAATKAVSPAVETVLDENSLQPGKHEHISLTGSFDEKGSYLATVNGLRLRQISQRAHLIAVRLVEDKSGGGLAFYQNDDTAWDQFSIKGAKKIVAFDAGEFEIDAAGEKPVAEKAPEPDL